MPQGYITSAAAPADPRREPRWIPASPLVAALAFQLAAWVIVGIDGVTPRAGLTFAWVHAVALGWITTVALSVLVRILPGTTDRPWRLESLARGALAGVAGGAALVVCGFVWNAQVLVAGAVIAACAIGAYAFAAARTLSSKGGGRREAVIAAALGATLAALTLTAAFGVALALAIGRGVPVPAWTPRVHATLGIVGWLTALTTGVATRTLPVILDVRTRIPIAHIAVGQCLIVGLLTVLFAQPGTPLALAGWG